MDFSPVADGSTPLAVGELDEVLDGLGRVVRQQPDLDVTLVGLQGGVELLGHDVPSSSCVRTDPPTVGGRVRRSIPLGHERGAPIRGKVVGSRVLPGIRPLLMSISSVRNFITIVPEGTAVASVTRMLGPHMPGGASTGMIRVKGGKSNYRTPPRRRNP